MAASSLLCVFGVVWFCADFSSSLVAALLLQHSLRDGDAAGFALGAGILSRNFVISATGEFKPALVRLCRECVYRPCLLCNAGLCCGIDPLTYVEGTKNIESRRAFEEADSACTALTAGDAIRGRRF